MTDAPLNAFNRAPFAMSDILRRAQGHAFGTLGLGPSECPYQIAASGPFWRLRDYGNDTTAPSVFIIAAPIKRPYIWDLSPTVSAIRYCSDKACMCTCLNGCRLLKRPATMASANTPRPSADASQKFPAA